MTKPRRRSRARHPLVGTWRPVLEFYATVEYRIVQRGRRFLVRARNDYDGEVAEVFDTKFDSRRGEISCALYWASTGRLNRCRFLLIGPDQVEFTYTYTDSEVLARKKPTRRPTSR